MEYWFNYLVRNTKNDVIPFHVICMLRLFADSVAILKERISSKKRRHTRVNAHFCFLG